MLKIMKPVLVLVALLAFLPVAQGQPDGGGPGGGGPPVPISGLEWLLIAGGLMGGKQIWQKIKVRK